MKLHDIIGYTAYFGRHTLEAKKDGNEVKFLIFRNVPKKIDTIVSVSSKDELIELSNTTLKYHTGNLGGIHREYKKEFRVNRNGNNKLTNLLIEIPKIDYFLSCFKHKTN